MPPLATGVTDPTQLPKKPRAPRKPKDPSVPPVHRVVKPRAPKPYIIPENAPEWRKELGLYTQCEKCSLYQERVPALMGGGNLDAELILVGEFPNRYEMQQGEVFLGQPGVLVEKVLQKPLRHPTDKTTYLPALERDDLYLCNAVLCAPTKKTTLSVADVGACNTRLLEELKRLPKRRVIVLFGNQAVKAVTGKVGSVANDNGKVLWSKELQCHLVISFHPVTVMNQTDFYPDFKAALDRAREMLVAPLAPVVHPKQNYVVERDTDTAITQFQTMRAMQTVIACDIETDGLDWQNDPILAIGFSWEKGNAYILPPSVFTNLKVLPHLRALLEGTENRWVWHNGKFDTKALREQLGVKAHVDGDTMLLHYALDERTKGVESTGGKESLAGTHGLKPLAQKILGVPEWDTDLDQYLKVHPEDKRTHFRDIPTDTLYEYLACDCDYTRQLYFALVDLHTAEQKLYPTREGYKTPQQCHDEFLAPLSDVLADMERTGVYLDRSYMEQLDRTMRAEMRGLEERLQTFAREEHLAQKEFNVRSPEQIAEILYDVLKFPIPRDRFGNAHRTTDREALESFRGRHPFIDSLLQFRGMASTHRTFIEGNLALLDKQSRVHSNFKIPGAESGRLSSARPNLQNNPHNDLIRNMFGVPDDCWWVIADYNQLEVRSAADLSRDPALIEVCRGDIHQMIADEIFAKQYAQVRSATQWNQLDTILRNNPVLHKVKPPVQGAMSFAQYQALIESGLRDAAKPVTFGVMYNRQAYSLAHGELQCTVQEAQAYIEAFRARYPVLMAYLKEQQRLAIQRGYVETPNGRRRRFPFVTQDNQQSVLNQATNMTIQGEASDTNLKAMMRLHRIFAERKLGLVLFPVHDSISFQVYKDKLYEATEVIHYEMENVLPDSPVPYTIDLEWGTCWNDKKTRREHLRQIAFEHMTPAQQEEFDLKVPEQRKFSHVVKLAQRFVPTLEIRHSMPYVA